MKKLLLTILSSLSFSAFSQWITTPITSTGYDCISAFGNVYSSGCQATNALDVSSNDGATWSSSNVGITPSTGLYFGTFYSGKLYTCRGATIESTSTGNNWVPMTNTFTTNHNAKSMTAISGTVLAAINDISLNSCRIYEYNGSSWVTRSANYTNRQFTCIRDLNGTIFAGTTATCVLKSTDAGVTFSYSSVGMPTPVFWDKYINCLAATNSATPALFAGTQGGRICRSTDNGATWSTVYLIGDGTLSIDISDIYVMSNNNILVACDSGFIYSSNNGAAGSWIKSNSGLPRNTSNRFDINHITVSSGTTPYIIASDKNGKIMRRALSEIFSGIKENILISIESKVYPNPANGFAVIEASDLLFNDKCEVKLNDVLGREVGVFEMKEGKANLNLENFSKGLYTYSVYNNKTIVSKGKLVVN